MRRRLGTAQCLPAILAVLLLVFANSSHFHIRYCLDGAEAPISIHFESEETHASNVATIDNHGDDNLADIESELSIESLLTKLSKTPTDLAILAFNLHSISEASKTPFQIVGREILPDKPVTLLPPARAPPAIA